MNINKLYNWFRTILFLQFTLSAFNAGAVEVVTYIHTDIAGSPIAASDADGDLLWKEDYRPYGAKIRNQSSSQKLWYTGKPFDDDLELSYYGARWYEPAIGRFMGVDPAEVDLGNIHSFNRYVYANNNPYRFVDPDGRNALAAFGGLLYETGQLLTGNGFDADSIAGAFVDGYNGGADEIGQALFEDVTSFVPVGASVGVVAKLSKLAKVAKAAKKTPGIKWGQQEKHFPGHNSYKPGRSTLTSNPEKLAKQAGTGQQVGKTPVGQPGSKERVDFGERIGTYIDRGGNASDTTKGIIHYGKDGIHIVPARP